MKRLLALLCSLLAALGLPGCDKAALEELRPGVSTAMDVKARMGPPNHEWRNEDGSVTWEYSRQPEGTQCYMATLGADGVLRQIEQVLTPAHFERIQPGMTAAQVQRQLGRPARKQFFELKQEHFWRWFIERQISGHKLYFTVTFNTDGRVTSSGTYAEQEH